MSKLIEIGKFTRLTMLNDIQCQLNNANVDALGTYVTDACKTKLGSTSARCVITTLGDGTFVDSAC